MSLDIKLMYGNKIKMRQSVAGHLKYLFRCDKWCLPNEIRSETAILYPYYQRLPDSLEECERLSSAFENIYIKEKTEQPIGRYEAMEIVVRDNLGVGNQWLNAFWDLEGKEKLDITTELIKKIKTKYSKSSVIALFCHGGQIKKDGGKNYQMDVHFHALLYTPLNNKDDNLYYGTVPKYNGKWDGERGNSIWIPDDNFIPSKNSSSNPERLTWKHIKEKFGIQGIPFHNNQPDFSSISKAMVALKDRPICENRYTNFKRANEIEAQRRGCSGEDVAQWIKQNRYTWHEESNGWIMLKVPRLVHDHVPHAGGVSNIKANNKILQLIHRREV